MLAGRGAVLWEIRPGEEVRVVVWFSLFFFFSLGIGAGKIG